MTTLSVTFGQPAVDVSITGQSMPVSTGTPIIRNDVSERNYENLSNKPSINGVELVGDKTSEDLHLGSAVFPTGGQVGDLLAKVSGDGVGWITPATSAEADNTRPITSAAVYTEIGNINALLGTI